MRHLRKLIGPSLIRSLWLAASLAVASPALAHEAPAEAANKKVVLDFYGALNAADAAGTTKARIQAIAETYISPDYVQHSAAFADLPGPGNARDRLIRMFQIMPAMPPMAPPKTLAVMAQGDLVMMLTTRDMPDQAPAGQVGQAYIFNMFRVRNGLLVEHWDVGPQPEGPGVPGMPPPSR